MFDIYNDIFRMIDLMSHSSETPNRVSTSGLKGIISKPHNLYSIKDENGEIVEWQIDTVYTPFTKDDISATVSDGVLSVEIGGKNKEADPNLVYGGISNQYSKFAIRLADSIDFDNITTSAVDGILKIKLPVKKQPVAPSRVLTIN